MCVCVCVCVCKYVNANVNLDKFPGMWFPENGLLLRKHSIKVPSSNLTTLYTHHHNSLKIKGIPLHDRQTALALLLELTLQRGTLQHLLDAVLLLLQLSEVTGSTHKGEVGGPFFCRPFELRLNEAYF